MVFRTLKHYRKQNFYILFLTSVESGGIVGSTVYLAKIMNGLIDNDKEQFIRSFLVSILLWGIALIIGYFKNRYVEITKQKQVLYIRKKILERISKKSYFEFFEKDINEYTSWLTNDINIIEDQCFGNFYLSISSLTLILFSAVAIFNFSWVLLLVAVVAAILMTIIPKMMRKKLDDKNNKLSRRYERYVSRVDEWIKGFPTLISYNKTNLLKEKIAVENKKISDVKNELGKTKVGINSGIKCLSVIFQYAIILITGLFILVGKLTGGVIFSIGDLTANFFGNMSFFIDQVTTFLSTSQVIEKISFSSASSFDNSYKTNKISFEKSIKVNDLEYQYSNGKTVKIPNMIFEKGGKYAILGKSGTGKSTFLNILSKNLPYHNGTIKIDNINLAELDEVELRNTLSYVKQQPYIFDLNLNDNLTLFDTFESQVTENIIKKMDLEDLTSSISLGLFGKNISGGQAQRVEIGRSLIQEKEILLIDEGTSNLDVTTSYIIEKSILLNPNLTVIFVTHHLNNELKNLFTKIYTF